MAGLLQFPLDRLVTVKLAVGYDARKLVFARDGLIPRRKVDDAESRVSERYAPVGGDPVALSIRATVTEAQRGALQQSVLDRLTT